MKEETRERYREGLRDMAALVEKREGRRALARLLWEMGMGRACQAEELYGRNMALGFFERLRVANPQAAANVLLMIWGFEE